MTTNNGIKRFINGGAPALIKHIFAVLGFMGAAVVAGTLFYAEVKDFQSETGRSFVIAQAKADENRKRVKVIENKINEVTTQQRLLLQRSEDERELNKDFRSETGRALNEILLRLPRLNRPIR